MFGKSDDIRRKTKTETMNEPCYGGFGGRFSYELFRSKNRKAKLAQLVPKIATLLVSCIFFGGLGTLAGMMIYHVIQGNFISQPPMEESRFDKESMGDDGLNLTDSPTQLSVTSGGAEMVSVTKEDSERYRIPMGVLIKELPSENIGYTAGVREGDIIVMIDDAAVLGVEELSRLADGYKTEDSVSVRVFRDGEYHDFVVKMK